MRWSLSGTAAALSDGTYTLAILPLRVRPMRAGDIDVPITGTVLVTEASGWDSSAHFRFADDAWVSLWARVHAYQVGDTHTFYMHLPFPPFRGRRQSGAMTWRKSSFPICATAIFRTPRGRTTMPARRLT